MKTFDNLLDSLINFITEEQEHYANLMKKANGDEIILARLAENRRCMEHLRNIIINDFKEGGERKWENMN